MKSCQPAIIAFAGDQAQAGRSPSRRRRLSVARESGNEMNRPFYKSASSRARIKIFRNMSLVSLPVWVFWLEG